jgi:predicted  nucleic acid-binding Zn-ribbon protein
MSHTCLRCNATYDDDAAEVIGGCACGAHVFRYARNGRREGKYQFDLTRLFSGEAGGEPDVLTVAEGKYEIDLARAWRRERS